MNEHDVIDIVKQMGTFMKQTNEMLATLNLRTQNQQLDIDKFKKEIQTYKNNGNKYVQRKSNKLLLP